MGNLCDLPNIGKTSEKRLIACGINSAEELLSIGSKDAFLRLRSIEGDTCINTLYALQGAIAGIRWHYLDEEIKKDLMEFYKSL